MVYVDRLEYLFIVGYIDSVGTLSYKALGVGGLTGSEGTTLFHPSTSSSKH